MSLPHTWIDTRDFYREECRKRGLHSSGSKGAMRARLEASLLDGAVGVGDAQLGVAAVVEDSMEVASPGLGDDDEDDNSSEFSDYDLRKPEAILSDDDAGKSRGDGSKIARAEGCFPQAKIN